jgi:DNA-directed RNA polymerase specialized sigma24 family protein
MSAPNAFRRILEYMERFTEGSRRAIVTVENTTADVSCAIHSLSESDLLRLKALARLWSRGLPGCIGWSDVLHEAIARALSGVRKWPAGVSILAFLSGIMRSICEDQWRREQLEQNVFGPDRGLMPENESDGSIDPERAIAAAQALAVITQLFASDPLALKIIAGLADGHSAADICERYGLSQREYDTTRKRMRRALLRNGIEWSAS